MKRNKLKVKKEVSIIRRYKKSLIFKYWVLDRILIQGD